MTRLLALVSALSLVLLSACATPAPEQGGVPALTDAILRLSPEIDPGEARRVAEIAHAYPLGLKREWNVVDNPLVHNAKVHAGEREKGLCNDWAQAMTRRLNAEGFETLSVHWATSPPSTFRIIHHSAVISARGDTLFEGIVLDPWRHSGELFWSRIPEDTRFDWRPRSEVRQALIDARDG